MFKSLKKLSKRYTIGIVSSSNYERICNQIKDLTIFRFLFCENGTVVYDNCKLIHQVKFSEYVGEDNFKKLINFILVYLSQLDIPIKRGNFIDCRNGLLSICPIGRSCSISERMKFIEYEEKECCRKKFIEYLNKNFTDYDIDCTIGGKISFEVFPKGWDKTYCLRFLKNFNVIFYGDRVCEYGNDLSIYNAVRVKYNVESPEDTLKIVKSYLIE
jgi:phosphomannomutase